MNEYPRDAAVIRHQQRIRGACAHPRPALFAVLRTAARFYGGRVYRAAATAVARPQPVILIGTTSNGRTVTLRPPRLSDGPIWRECRLRDRADIEPFWVTTHQDWNSRHSSSAWMRECLQSRSDAKSGRVVHTVIEVEGHLTGQCELWIETFDQRGELSLWMASHHAGQGIGTTAARLLVEYAFTELNLARVTAPTDVDNARSARLALRLGMTREGTMDSYACVGGRRRAHDLWAITDETWHVQQASARP